MIDLDGVAPEIATGDERSFAWWMARAELPLRRSLASYAIHVDVEAVLQETLLRVWQIAPRFRSDGKPNGLLRLARRIAHNLAVDALRRSVPATGAQEPLEIALDPVEPDPFLREAVATCREALPERPRAALDARLTDGGGQPDRALADAVGMRLNTFLQNVTRARQLLVECLARRGITLDEVWR